MTFSFASALQLLIAANGLLLAAGLLALRFFGRSANPALPLIFFTFALQMAGEFAHQTRSSLALSELRAALSLVYGPLFYLYFLNFAEPRRGLRWKDVWHGIPFFVAVATLAAALYFGVLDFSIHLYAAAAGVSLLGYAWLSWRNVRPKLASNSPARRLQWAALAAAMTGLMIGLTVVATNFNCEFIENGPVLWTRNALLISIVLLMNGFLLGGLWDDRVLFSARHVSTSTQEDEAILKALDDVLEQERLFADPEVTLDRLAAALSLRPRRVSEAVNRLHDVSVPAYINRRRVEEAKKLLAGDAAAGRSLLALAHDAGFNSKATFNRAFKEIVGETPSAYRQRVSGVAAEN